MRTFTLMEALERHSITSRPVSLKELHSAFAPRPRGSTRALLIKMGPFKPDVDAFRFTNEFGLTAANFVDFAEFFSEELVEQLTRLLTPKYLSVLNDIRIPVPLFPDITLPDAVVDPVMTAVKEQFARVFDLVFPPILEGEFGRCGGMAFAGYDFYLQGRPVDGFGTTPPTEGQLGDYLYSRLLDSLDLNARTFLEWWMIVHVLPGIDKVATATLLAAAAALGGPVGIAIVAFVESQTDIFDFGGADKLLKKTTSEWKDLKDRLDKEAACPLGLIFSDKPNLFDQHQVLAVDYSDDGLGVAELVIWDNSLTTAAGTPAPGRTLSLDFRQDTLRVSEQPKPGGSRVIKGIFCEEYTPKTPPAI
jgi:hypothetical protein